MERGNLIIYDSEGVVQKQTGYATGDILPHDYPNDALYLELPYGDGRFVKSVDVSKAPHEPIFFEFENG